MSGNLFSTIEASITDAAKVFITTPDGKAYSYGDMLTRSAQYANTLATLGVKVGDRVAVQLDKSPDALFLYLACLRLGAVYLPLNSDYTPSELTYFLGDAKPVLAVCSPSNKAAFEKIIVGTSVRKVRTLSDDGTGSLPMAAAISGKSFATVSVKKDNLAAILYTSGTTGRSKGAMLSHENLRSNALTLVKYWQFTESDVLLHPLPIFHTHGLFVATNTVLLSGSSIILLPKFDVAEMIKQMPDCTVMMGVPTHYLRLLATPDFTRGVVKDMRLFISGSAPLSAETHKDFEHRTGRAILERYGMTETNMITSNPYGGERIAGTVGFALPDVDVRIADADTGAVLPQGDIGVIEVRGPNVFKGYWQMPDKTAAEFRSDGYFITGDLGQIDKRGYISIVGREKDLIISGGLNVYPAEIEAALDAVDGITESAVIGLPHPDFGEAVTAVVALADGAPPGEQQIINAMAVDLAKFKVPKRVIFVGELPRNTMGKIQKKAMRETYAALYKQDSNNIPIA